MSVSVIETRRDPFFEDVVNHMAAICLTDIAVIAMEDGRRTWINRPGEESGRETNPAADKLIEQLGREKSIENGFGAEAANWPFDVVPRAYISLPFTSHDNFAGLLIVADVEPRTWGAFEINYMVRSARLVASHFEARQILAERDRALKEISIYQNALDKFALVSVTDATGAIIHANEPFCAISGYARDELLGADHRIVNSGEHPKSFFVDMWRTIGQERLWRGEICNRAKNGSKYWVDTTIVPMPDASDFGTKRFMSIRIDCTERHVAKDKLAAALKALEQERNNLEARVVERTLALEDAVTTTQKASAAKSLFLATVSHELRTPLHHIINYAEIVHEDVEDGLSDPQQVMQDVSAILTSSRHLLALINDTLDLSKTDAGKMILRTQTVMLLPLLEECVASVRHTAERNGNIVAVDADHDVTLLETDRLRLKQCLLNLLSNAAKFTSNGTIVVRARHALNDGARVLRISVADTGIGMTVEQQALLFEPFCQVDSSHTRAAEGTGLGLALSQKIVQLLGGVITLESAPDKGSTFTIELPLEAQNASPLLVEA